MTLTIVGLNTVSAHAAANDVLIFTPKADSYVDKFHPDTNFGSSVGLSVRLETKARGRQSFLRFDVQGVTGRTVVRVRLRLFQTDPNGSPSGGRVFKITNNTWDESVITWNTRPTIDGPRLAIFGPVQPGHPYAVDLGTSLVPGDGPVSLAMKSAYTDISTWGSREHADPPQLIVYLAPKSVPPSVDKFSFSSVADAYVDSSNPSSNFGTLPSFWVESTPTRQSLMRFSVSGLAGRTVKDVRLRLFQVDASPQGGRVFKFTDDSWDESSVTWNNRPDIYGPGSEQLNNFGTVAAGHWYEVDLRKVITGNGTLDLAVDSVNSNAARWASRESANAPKLIVSVARIPGLILDGLSTVAQPSEGSNEPTYFANQHHMVKTTHGRLLVIYGRHASGLQLAWRDPGGGWQTDTTGAVSTGQLLSGSGTGDWPASIAIAKDSLGRYHAWVVWARPSFANTNGVVMRRLSNLESASGPRVGRKVTVSTAGLGTAHVDVGFETSGSTRRGVVIWTRKTGATSWAIVTKWFRNLDTNAPAFRRPRVLTHGTGQSRAGTLIPSAFGMRAAVRDSAGKMHLFGHNLGKPLDSWWSGTPGVDLPTEARVAGVALSTGRLAVTAESDTVNHVVTVQMFTKAGRFPSTKLTTDPGYAQPVLATDGTNLYLVMVKTSDGSVVSRKYDGLTKTWGSDVEEISAADCGGNCSWPNVIRGTGGRLRFVVRGPNAGSSRNAVLAFQRKLP